MAYVYSARGEVFKLELICMQFRMADGKLRRGLVMGVGEVPGNPNILRAVICWEGPSGQMGAVTPKMINKLDFERAQLLNDHIGLHEAPDVHAPGVLVGINGHAIETKL